MYIPHTRDNISLCLYVACTSMTKTHNNIKIELCPFCFSPSHLLENLCPWVYVCSCLHALLYGNVRPIVSMEWCPDVWEASAGEGGGLIWALNKHSALSSSWAQLTHDCPTCHSPHLRFYPLSTIIFVLCVCSEWSKNRSRTNANNCFFIPFASCFEQADKWLCSLSKVAHLSSYSLQQQWKWLLYKRLVCSWLHSGWRSCMETTYNCCNMIMLRVQVLTFLVTWGSASREVLPVDIFNSTYCTFKAQFVFLFCLTSNYRFYCCHHQTFYMNWLSTYAQGLGDSLGFKIY